MCFVLGAPGPAKAAVNATGSHQQQLESATQAEGTSVTGYDTPCQRAVVRAQKESLRRPEQSLATAVGGLKQQLYQWVRQEQLWGSAWARMIEELDTV